MRGVYIKFVLLLFGVCAALAKVYLIPLWWATIHPGRQIVADWKV